MDYEVFLDQAKNTWPTTEFEYIIVGSVKKNSKIRIICKKHQESFDQIAARHLEGRAGCEQCIRENRSPLFTFEQFVEKARIVHGQKYEYIQSSYTKIRAQVTIVCLAHGEFSQWADNHVRGAGCRKCAIDDQRGVFFSSVGIEKFLARVKEIHRDKYLVDEESFTGMARKVKVQCPEHGVFNPIANHFVRGQRCPGCSLARSQGEQQIHDLLEKSKIPFIEQWAPTSLRDYSEQKLGRGMRFDFMLPEQKILIEYDGPQHKTVVKMYQKTWAEAEQDFENLQKRDKLKNTWARNNSWRMIRICSPDGVTAFESKLDFFLNSSKIFEEIL